MPRAALAFVIATALIGMAGCSKSAAPTPAPAADDSAGSATVSTVSLQTGRVSQTITAYGSVTAEPGAVAVLSVSVECRVNHLRVAGGQSIDEGAFVIEVEPSPDAKLQLSDARNAWEGAKKESADAHQRFDLKLATVTDVQTADAALRSAQSKLDDLTRRGAGEDHRVLAADTAGVVAKVDVQEGQLVPAGSPLVEIVPRGQIEVRLGIEPAEVSLVRAGQSVRLFPTTAGPDDEPIETTVRLVTQRVDPDSRRVDTFAAPAETDGLLLGTTVRGELTVRTVSGMVVPHDALLRGDDGFTLFTVSDGKAVKHAVQVSVQDDQQAVVTGPGLSVGDAVVIAGGLELDDGTAVNVTAPTSSPTTSPNSAPAEDDQ